LSEVELERWCGAYEAGGARFLLVPRGCFLYATGDRVGLALPGGGRLVVVRGPENETEIGAYAVSGGEVVGLWVPPGADQGDYSACGVERSVVEGESGRITSAFAIDKSGYAGRAVWVPRGPAMAGGKPVGMRWELEDGLSESFGADFRDAVCSTFCFEPEKLHGLAVDAWGEGVAMDSAGRVWEEQIRARD